MLMSEKLKEISKENSYKNDLLSDEIFNKLVAAAEKGEFSAIIKIIRSKDIEILRDEGFKIYDAYNRANVYVVSWEGEE